jgi:hypothetical protein
MNPNFPSPPRTGRGLGVRRHNHEVRLAAQFLHPDGIFGVAGELVVEADHAVLRLNHLVQAVSEFGSEMVVEEKLHAASDCS